jgi:hypothetical protein
MDNYNFYVQKYLADKNIKSYYQRSWFDEDGSIWIDFGSHTEFFVLRDGKELEG